LVAFRNAIAARVGAGERHQIGFPEEIAPEHP